MLRELKNYLLFLKDYGYTEIPQRNKLNLSASKKTGKAILSPSTRDNDNRLQAVREELGDCTRCKLSEGRNKIVFGSGNPNADLVFVGPAAGQPGPGSG
jgi:DNA polymerase